jgi:hypothetical protein
MVSNNPCSRLWHAPLTYFHPNTVLHLSHRISLTVCIPVVICLSSASPKFTFTTLLNKNAFPCCPLNWREMRSSAVVRWV